MGRFDMLDIVTQFEFIETLRSFPCLWDEKSEAYKSPRKKEHKAQRNNAFAALLAVLQNNDRYRDATMETVKDLHSSLSSSFQIQRNKVILNPMHRPKVWYHFLADFLLYRSERRSSLTPTQIHGDATQFLHVNLQECPDSSQVDYRCPTNLTQNRRNDGISSPPQPGPTASNNIIDVPDTSTNNAASSPEPKRRKLGSSSTRTSIDKDFGNYAMIALSKMDEDERVKAEGKITEILREGLNRRL